MPDLITLTRAKQAIAHATSSDDDLLETLITAASAAIERWCRRTFTSTSHTEKYTGDGKASLWLNQYPVTALDRIAVAGSVALVISNTDGATNQRATVNVGDTGLTLQWVASGTSTVDTTVTWSANPTVTQVVTAVNALGNGWSAAVRDSLGSWPSADLVPTAAPLWCLAREIGVYAYDHAITDAILDSEAGEIHARLPAGFQNLRIHYTAGYATIPEDIQQACALLVAHWFAETRRDGVMQSERLGDYTYHRGPEAGMLTPALRSLLEPYRNHRP